MVVLLLGIPGSGKGSQARRLARWLGIPSVSTGEMLRAEAARHTPLGRELAQRLSRGLFAGDDLVNRIVAGFLDRDGKHGAILDGYPRTLPQAAYLDNLLIERALPPAAAVHLDLPHEAALLRIPHRRECRRCGFVCNLHRIPPAQAGYCDDCGAELHSRSDDGIETFAERLKEFATNTQPVVEHYRQRRFYRIDANQTVDEVFQAVRVALPRVGTAQLGE